MALAEQNIPVLQGGAALGAYQAGAFDQLARHGKEPSWVAGISIGAINAAIICGNPPDKRRARLRGFWEDISAFSGPTPWLAGAQSRQLYGEFAAAAVMATGVPGIFRPNPAHTLWPFSAQPALSFYDTSPLWMTLEDCVDFDYLNDRGPRISVGAVDIETAKSAFALKDRHFSTDACGHSWRP